MHLCNLPAAAAAKLPFSQAVRLGDVLYLSGALGNVPGTRNVVPGGIEAETKQTMENIGAVLKRQRTLLRRRVQMHGGTRRHRAMGDLQLNKVYVTYFKPGLLRARSAFGANGLALGPQVELECLAYAGKK